MVLESSRLHPPVSVKKSRLMFARKLALISADFLMKFAVTGKPCDKMMLFFSSR